MSTPAITETTPFAGHSTTSLPQQINHTITPNTTLLVVVFGTTQGGANALTVGGVPLACLPGSFVSGISVVGPQIWYLANPSPGHVVIEITTQMPLAYGTGNIYNVQGNDSTLFGPAIALVSTGARTLTAVVASAPDDLLIDCAFADRWVPPSPMDPGPGQTELFDLSSENPHYRAAGSSKASQGLITTMSYTVDDHPILIIFRYLAVAIHGTPIPIPQSSNVLAVRRLNYAVIRWNPLTQDMIGRSVTATSYIVQRASLMDESDIVTIATITTTDAEGQVDTAFVDTNPPPTAVYRVVSVAGSVQSEASDPAVAIASPSLIDGKSELLDQRLLFWDNGNWDDRTWA